MIKYILLALCLTSVVMVFGQKSPYNNLGETFKVPKGLNEIGDIIYESETYRSEPKKRLEYLDKALKLSKQKQDTTLLPYIYFNKADAYIDLSKSETALTYLDQVKEQINWEDFNFLLSRVYGFKAYIYQMNGDGNLAIENYLEVINNTEFDKLLLKSKSNMIAIYSTTERCNIAKLYIDEILNYFKKHQSMVNQTNVLGFVYMNASYCSDSYEQKLMFANKAVNAIKKDAIADKLQAYIVRGNLYYDNDKNNLALADYNKALTLAKEIKNIPFIIEINQYISRVFLNKKKADLANVYLDSAQLMMVENELRLRAMQDDLRVRAYKQLKQFDSALFYAERQLKHKDSLIQYSRDSLYIAYGKKYQTDQKIQENELLKRDNAIKDLEVQQQKTQRNYLILFSVLGIIALGATYSRYRYKRKSAYRYKQQNIIINQQKAELEKSNANKQKLFGIIAHDLVSPFQAILGYTNLLNEDYHSFSEEERMEFIGIINKYANSNYNLTRALLDWAKVQQDKLVVNKTMLNCKAVVENAMSPYLVLADKKDIHITLNIPENTTVEADANMMQTVIGNLDPS